MIKRKMCETLKKKFEDIFDKVQNNTSCHQKFLKVLTAMYQKSSLDEFVGTFLEFLAIFMEQLGDNNVYLKRCLTFCSRFCGDLTLMEEKHEEPHELLTRVLDEVLEWSCLPVYELRYNACRFITMVLQNIRDEVQLEIDLIDKIQRVMLERMKETKVSLRLQAISALVRLQDPHNPECPVIAAYLHELYSGSANIRKEVVTHLAPNGLTVGKIRERIRDVDPGVRSMAFHRVADIGPFAFGIADKQEILLCGFQETNETVKNTIYDYLLPKWLTAYKGDFMKFVAALKLIADDNDLATIEFLVEKLIVTFFYQKHPVNDLIAVLPINGDDKVVKAEFLTNEVTLFWKVLVNLLRESDLMDDYLERILPELTPFCKYIESVIKVKSQEKMDDWKYFEHQFDIYNLFEIAEKYDFSDEVGRRTMQSLTVTVLQEYSFNTRLTKKIVSIAHACSSNIEFFTNDMCQLISNIREPFIEEPLTEGQQIERNFRIAELRVKINNLQEAQDEAVKSRDYQQAHLIEKELAKAKLDLEKMQSGQESEKVRVIKSDTETLCHCLDILMCVLELPAVTKPTPSLLTCRDHFLLPLLSNQSVEPHWRMLRCLSMFCLFDRDVAEEYIKIISIPMVTYRTIPNINASVLVQSIAGVTDVILYYGVDILNKEDEDSNITTSNQATTKRRLYNNEIDEDNLAKDKRDTITLAYVLEIFLEMLDDERDEVKRKIIYALGSLIDSSLPVTASLLTRLLLKWFNPLTGKQDPWLQVNLGLLLETFIKCKVSSEIMKDAIVPTFVSIANAPRTSPLFEIDSDNVLTFFAEMMNIKLKPDDIKILALDICMKISENANDRLVTLLAKFLNHLDIKKEENVDSLRELIDRAEMLYEAMKDKIPKRYIDKFLSKLKQDRATTTTNTTSRTEEIAEDDGSKEQEEDSESTVFREISTENLQYKTKEPQQVKRRKHRSSQNCVVVLERFDEKNKNETTLHTIIESSMERMEVDEELTIETPTSESSNDSKKSSRRENNIIISETSDSDFSNDNGMTRRRSNRLRKKRIV